MRSSFLVPPMPCCSSLAVDARPSMLLSAPRLLSAIRAFSVLFSMTSKRFHVAATTTTLILGRLKPRPSRQGTQRTDQAFQCLLFNPHPDAACLRSASGGRLISACRHLHH